MRFLARFFKTSRCVTVLLLSLSFSSLVPALVAQSNEDVAHGMHLISGATAFLTRTDGGKISCTPVVAPLLAAPVGTRLLFESHDKLAHAGGRQPEQRGCGSPPSLSQSIRIL